ncbi:MAG TPA: RIP metalloprotease RseP [Gallionellaceae bacterium]|nr:RIP metalloprotease RseP [Gallionellaceae bacterium]
MTTLLAFITAIVVLVAFHEYGHYWVARLCGVKVLRFSIGFGKILYSRKFSGGETEWSISAIPLGGYVKMLDEREGEVRPEELHRAFNRQPVLRRMAIVVAGPVANLLLAIVLYWGLFIYGVPGLKPILGNITPNSAAAAAQLQAQQTIIGINGVETPTWQDVRWALLDSVLQGGTADLEIRTLQGETAARVLNISTLTAADLDSDFLRKLGMQPFQPLVRPVIGKLIEGGVAQRAGVKTDDTILSANGQLIENWEAWVEMVRSHPASPLHLEIMREGHVIALDLTPDSVQEGDKRIGKIGAAPLINQQEFDALMTEVRYSPLNALGKAVRKTWETSVVSLQMMGRMIVGQVSLKNLSGPVTIADYAGQSASMGLSAYLSFLALISISLGVLNLLPIPLLDGGHLLYYMVELIKGSPVPEVLWEAGQKVGIALLFTLMALALFNDFSRLILN